MTKKVLWYVLLIIICTNIDSTDIDTAGNFKIKPYSAKQESDLRILTKDIDEFHKKISELLPFMEKEKKIIGGKYTKQLSAYKDSFPLRTHDQFMINEQFVISVGKKSSEAKDIPIETITFSRRKSRVSKLKEELYSIYEIANTSAGKMGHEGVELRLTNTTSAGTEPIKIYNEKNIVDPRERVKLIRNYRNNLELALRQMDKVVQNNFKLEELDTQKTMRELH